MEYPFSTSDTALATFLITSGYFIKGIDYSKPRFEFVFNGSDDIQRLANQYIAGQALTEPNAFNRVNRKLLRIISKRKQWEED